MSFSSHDLHDRKLLLEQSQGKEASTSTPTGNAPGPRLPELESMPISREISARPGRSAKNFSAPRTGTVTTNRLMPRRPATPTGFLYTGAGLLPETTHADGQGLRGHWRRHWNGAAMPRTKCSPASTAAIRSRPASPGARCWGWHQVIEAVKSGPSGTSSCGRVRRRTARPDTIRVREKDPCRHGSPDLACGKYRFNDPGPGDHRQPAPADGRGASATMLTALSQIAIALADAFGCGVQRPAAVYGAFLVRAEGCVHPADLAAPGHSKHPVLVPCRAFLSPNVLELSRRKLRHRPPITTPEEDLKPAAETIAPIKKNQPPGIAIMAVLGGCFAFVIGRIPLRRDVSPR